jgi:hypothetical protein
MTAGLEFADRCHLQHVPMLKPSCALCGRGYGPTLTLYAG